MERNEDLIDLGAASTETKGPGGPINDQVLGQLIGGLSDDRAKWRAVHAARHCRCLAMGYALRNGVSFCRIGNRFVFLDLPNDRYFCLGSESEQAFAALVSGTSADSAAASGPAKLVEQGLVRLVADEVAPAPCGAHGIMPPPGDRSRIVSKLPLACAMPCARWCGPAWGSTGMRS